MGAMSNSYNILVGKPKEKRPRGRLWDRWEDDIIMDLRKLGGRMWYGWGQWRALVNTEMNLRVP
jgi:hypothetical protein